MNKEDFLDTTNSPKTPIKRPKIKPVAILNVKEHTPSPHILDLKQIQQLVQVPTSSNVWQSNVLHEFIAHPLSSIKKTTNSHTTAPKLPVFKTERGSFNISKHIKGFTRQLKRDVLAFLRHFRRAGLLFGRGVSFPFRVVHIFAQKFSTHADSASKQLRINTRALQEKIRTSIKPKEYIWENIWFKTASAFTATALLIIIPVKVFSAYSNLKENRASVQEQGGNAFQSLKASGSALLTLEDNGAIENIKKALALFSKANGELSEIGPITQTLLRLSPSRYAQFETGKHILRAGELISRALLPITSSLEALKTHGDDPLTNRLLVFQKAIQESLPLMTEANIELRGVKQELLPANYRKEFRMIQGTLGDLEADMRTADPLFKILYEILGGTIDKRYLVILQNNTEMRATGGFIGSFALLDMSRGEIKQIRFPHGGSYDLQGYLKVAVEPPTPLKILRTKWEFQDANWFPDFPASARKLAWFYEKSGGSTVDGVIALDTQILIDLLKLTGPITVPSFNKTISADNAILTIQTEVEINYDRQINEPKRFLGAVIEEIIKKIKTDPSTELPVLSILQNNLSTRHLQLMSFHKEEQQSIIDHDWGGALKNNPGGDYLAIINSNIGGQKTDGVIEQKARLLTSIQNDGTVVNTLTIAREHKGIPGETFYGVANIDYVRVLVPKGSTFINTTGFSYPEENMVKISEEHYAADKDLANEETNQKTDEASGTIINEQFDKTAFANWIITKPGETSVATITYRLPLNVFKTSEKSLAASLNTLFGNSDEQLIKYSLLIQKQAGMEKNNFSHHLQLPPQTEVVWMTPSNWSRQADLSYETSIQSQNDIFNGFIGRLIKN